MFNLSKDKGFHALAKRADLDAETKALIEQGADYATIRKSLFENMHPGNITTYRQLIRKAEEEEEEEEFEGRVGQRYIAPKKERPDATEEEEEAYRTQMGGRSNIGGSGRAGFGTDDTGPKSDKEEQGIERDEEAAFDFEYKAFKKTYDAFAILRDSLTAIKDLAGSMKVTEGDSLSGYDFSNVSAFRSLKKKQSNTIFNFMLMVRNNPEQVENFEDAGARVQTFFVERDEEGSASNIVIKPPPKLKKDKDGEPKLVPNTLKEIDVSRLIREYEEVSRKEFTFGGKTIDFLEAYEGLHTNRFNALPSGKESRKQSKEDLSSARRIIERRKRAKANIKRRTGRGGLNPDQMNDLDIALANAEKMKKSSAIKDNALKAYSEDLKERQIDLTRVLAVDNAVTAIAIQDAMRDKSALDEVDTDSPEFEKYTKAVRKRLESIIENQIDKIEEIENTLVASERYVQMIDETISVLNEVSSKIPNDGEIDAIRLELDKRERDLQEEDDKEDPDENKLKSLRKLIEKQTKYLQSVDALLNSPLTRKLGYKVEEVRKNLEKADKKYKSLDMEKHSEAVTQIKSALITRTFSDLGQLSSDEKARVRDEKAAGNKARRITLVQLMRGNEELKPLITDKEAVDAINALDKYIVAAEDLDDLKEKVESKAEEMLELEKEMNKLRRKQA